MLEGGDLLVDERTSRRNEDYFLLWKPPGEVGDDDCCNVSLAESCGQADEGVAGDAGAHDLLLVLSELRPGGISLSKCKVTRTGLRDGAMGGRPEEGGTLILLLALLIVSFSSTGLGCRNRSRVGWLAECCFLQPFISDEVKL